MLPRPSCCIDQPSDKRGGKRRKHTRFTAAIFLVAAGAVLALNKAQAFPIQDIQHRSTTQHIKRQDLTPGGGGQGIPGTSDPCSVLAKAVEPNITYDLIMACFENVPYNQTDANAILTTLYTFYKDFYIFVDSAQQPNQQKPFTNPPVDILAELRQLGQRMFANDFEFHREVDLVVNKLNDAHANYMPDCYQHYLYVQPLDLYAPVVNGVQSVKVLNDNFSSAGTKYQDCTVLMIDGENALSHIQKWVDVHYGFSKDAGVRLNKAMSQLVFSTDKMDWTYYAGQFTTRVTLPEGANMQFTIQCPTEAKQNAPQTPGSSNHTTNNLNNTNSNKVEQGDGEEDDGKSEPAGHVAQVVEDEPEKKPGQGDNIETLSIPWAIYRLVTWKDFTDTPSFVQANCLPLPPEPEEMVEGEPQQDQTEDDGEDDENLLKEVIEEIEKEKEDVKEIIEEIVDNLLNEENKGASTSASTPFTNQQGKSAPVRRPRSISDMQGHYYAESMERQSRTTILERRQDPINPGLVPPNERAAQLVYNGTSTAFFQLVKRPEVGVVVIPTHMVDHTKEKNSMAAGFELLHKRGVQKVILDLTGNGGGYVSFAYDLVDWMFPDEKVTSVYESGMRTSMSIKALADRDLTREDYDGYFNPNSFSDPKTQKTFETNFFLQDRLERRVRSSLGYTERVLMNHNLGAFDIGMPWQHHAQDMVVLTDGACGSACGMSLNRLKNRHGVASYAIGGRAHEDLSLFSFAGASVYGLDDLIADFETLKVDAPLRRMPYRGIYRVPVMEFYMENDPVPIEYHPSLYKADFHLEYSPETARHHEKFWELVADNHWKP